MTVTVSFNEVHHISDLELYVLENKVEIPRLVRLESGHARGLEWRSMAGYLDNSLKLGRVLQKLPKLTQIDWQYFFTTKTRDFDPQRAILPFASKTPEPQPCRAEDANASKPVGNEQPDYHERTYSTPTIESINESLEEVLKPRPRFVPELLSQVNLKIQPPALVFSMEADELWKKELLPEQTARIRQAYLERFPSLPKNGKTMTPTS